MLRTQRKCFNSSQRVKNHRQMATQYSQGFFFKKKSEYCCAAIAHYRSKTGLLFFEIFYYR